MAQTVRDSVRLRPVERRRVSDALVAALTERLACPVLARVYAGRVEVSADLNYDLDRLLTPTKLSGIDAAAALLERALREKTSILIVGDYDADGATSTAVAVRALRALGARVDYLIPNRLEYGYGLTPRIVALARERSPGLLITVDNGVASIEGVAAAKAAGMQVLVTDHHLPGDDLPDCDALVNPNIADDGFPSKHLAGVGVIFYVLLALRGRLRASGWFDASGVAEPNMASLLPLVALGTVADVARLDYNNRVLVQQGLRRINASAAPPGLLELLRVGGCDPATATARDLAFVAGPRLNAAGRIAEMQVGVECLLTEESDQAADLAVTLDELNRERRRIESDMRARAEDILDAMTGLEVRDAVCVFDEDWHPGVIGILASRLKDRLRRPVIAFAPGEQDTVRGSARSIDGVHIRDAIEAVANRSSGLVRAFGGHAMAAGLTLGRRDYERFCRLFELEVSRRLAASGSQDICLSDGSLARTEVSMELAERLSRGGPWGAGFPEPLFDDRCEVMEARIVGERHLKLRLRLDEAQPPIDAIHFNYSGPIPERRRRVHAVYGLAVNEFNQQRTVQMMLEQLEIL